MTAKAFNIKLDVYLYDQLRALSFLMNKPMTTIVRECIESGLVEQKQMLEIQQGKPMPDDVYKAALQKSMEQFDDVYKKLEKN